MRPVSLSVVSGLVRLAGGGGAVGWDGCGGSAGRGGAVLLPFDGGGMQKTRRMVLVLLSGVLEVDGKEHLYLGIVFG